MLLIEQAYAAPVGDLAAGGASISFAYTVLNALLLIVAPALFVACVVLIIKQFI